MQLHYLLAPWVNIETSNCTINGLEHDSRKIKPGDAFIAYAGTMTDGRLYIDKAVAAGATAVIYDTCSLPNITLPKTVPCIGLSHLTELLAQIAARFYNNAENTLAVTGITGTNGKTTIAYQLAQAHALLGQRAAYIGTLGQGEIDALHPLDNTTPDALCLQKLLNDYQKTGIKQLCMEVSSHALRLNRVDSITFNQAIFTNLTHDHLDFHITMQNYAEAKAELFRFPALKYAIINHDDGYSEFIQAKLAPSVQLLTYGLKEGALVRAVDWKIDLQGTTFTVQSPWGLHQIQLKALGKFNIYNGLAVFASLLVSGYPVEAVVTLMPKLAPAPGRMEVVATNPCVIVDYAHTPDALENSLATLDDLKKSRLWVIFGCGGDRDKTKRPMMAKACENYADQIIVTSDNPRTEAPEAIINDIMQGLRSPLKALKITDREAAISHALTHADKNDIILIAGKGHEDYQQIGKTRYRFSDQEIVRKKMQMNAQ